MRTAIARKGVAVVVISGDVALEMTTATPQPFLVPPTPAVVPEDADLDRLATLLNGCSRVTLLCGAGCAGAHDEVIALAKTLKAPIVHPLRGKEHIEYDNPYDVGMTGLIGFASGYYAMKNCETLLMLGTDFPYRQFYPDSAKIAQIDLRAEALGTRCRLDIGLVGDVKATVNTLLPRLKEHTDTATSMPRSATTRRRGARWTISPRSSPAAAPPSAISVSPGRVNWPAKTRYSPAT